MDHLKRQPLRHERLLMIPVASSVAEWWINTADRCVRPWWCRKESPRRWRVLVQSACTGR